MDKLKRRIVPVLKFDQIGRVLSSVTEKLDFEPLILISLLSFRQSFSTFRHLWSCMM